MSENTVVFDDRTARSLAYLSEDARRAFWKLVKALIEDPTKPPPGVVSVGPGTDYMAEVSPDMMVFYKVQPQGITGGHNIFIGDIVSPRLLKLFAETSNEAA